MKLQVMARPIGGALRQEQVNQPSPRRSIDRTGHNRLFKQLNGAAALADRFGDLRRSVARRAGRLAWFGLQLRDRAPIMAADRLVGEGQPGRLMPIELLQQGVHGAGLSHASTTKPPRCLSYIYGAHHSPSIESIGP
jgi:hypothetical protein